MNTKQLSVGDTIQTMHVGHSVTAIITAIKNTVDGIEYTVAYQGKPLWLDFGQNWKIQQGDTFTTNQSGIDRAAYWAKELSTKELPVSEFIAKHMPKV
jgi:hypothetical protein